MKKQLKLNKKTIKNLKLKLKAASDRKVAPAYLSPIMAPSNSSSC